MIRTIRLLIVSIFLIIGISSGNGAQQERVFDQAHLLNSAQIADLEARIDTFRNRYGLDVIAVTTSDTQGKSSRDYADDFYDYGNFGLGSEKDGFLLLIDMKNRQIYISTTGRAIRILTDRRIETILDRQYPNVKSGDYYRTFTVAIDAVSSMIDSDQRVTTTGGSYYAGTTRSSSPAPDKPISPIIARFIVSAIIGVFLGWIATIIVIYRYRSPFHPVEASERLNCRMELTQESDVFLGTRTTSRTIERESSGSGDGGGSSTHTSSSGQTHGGGGRSF